MRVTRPLFQFDPGWLFIMAGLAMCVPGVLIPAHHDLFLLQSQRDALRVTELHNNARLRAHVEFLQAVEQGDPDLTRRLVASQLNLIPETETAVLLAANPAGAITNWLETAARVETPPQQTWIDSTLSRLVNGPRRLWLLGGGVMSVFLGLMFGGAFSVAARPGA